ncbi:MULTISPECIES: 16S rRNA (cytidine(1402)-2'-O)-methyltransferase [Metabacillus]|jgi:16S rRNA (cytidine1402-2'-O)-methyltransferase|uniref:Ribosomal RNA small subunit methyltransferase I n=3 Tax=Metabacillus TaxID=2675233 RepID=A0A179SY32_9BACI|nr:MULTISPECIES: 16S rRNA (cytidine(1402)-2'-O)-methyltransferase [Metabacillus]OAS85739.1 rRNA (cytidine-2'-O-)-methyltransferase [Metabacillus litoralis]QNF27713.1 16S rRNA (cytidine(1402)-2'-O)-methyltransferase [Metabacillus sp. KUDC1714]
MLKRQKSFHNGEKEIGDLYLVPTPIGNLEDMTFRAIKILKEVDLIAAEDTRQSRKLCNYFEIETSIFSYHEHNKETSGNRVLELLQQKKNIALISDAGMPTISDPGSELVKQVLALGGSVIPLPGANAALTALIASGISPQPFYFFGFLDRQKKEKKNQLESLRGRVETIILYESPHRLKETLQLMKEYLGNRSICLSRELTKKFEEFIRGNIDEIIKWSEENEIRGEFCIIVEGTDEDEISTAENTWWSELTIMDHVEHYIQQDVPSKEAIKRVSIERGIQKREVYQAYHID